MDWRGWIFPRFGTRNQQMAESLSPPDPDDLDRLEELRERGSKLTLPHPVRIFISFPDEKAARSATDMLERDGYKCRLRTAAADSWTLTAIVTIIPTPGVITRQREKMEEIAGSLGGSYRGWDAPVVY